MVQERNKSEVKCVIWWSTCRFNMKESDQLSVKGCSVTWWLWMDKDPGCIWHCSGPMWIMHSSQVNTGYLVSFIQHVSMDLSEIYFFCFSTQHQQTWDDLKKMDAVYFHISTCCLCMFVKWWYMCACSGFMCTWKAPDIHSSSSTELLWMTWQFATFIELLIEVPEGCKRK